MGVVLSHSELCRCTVLYFEATVSVQIHMAAVQLKELQCNKSQIKQCRVALGEFYIANKINEFLLSSKVK